MFLVLRKMELEDMTKFVLEFNVKWKICKGYLTQTVLKPLCVLGNQISGSSYPMCIYQRVHSFLTYIEIWRGTGDLRFSFCWIRDFSILVQPLLSLIQMLSCPYAFCEAWAVEPLEMDHWTDDGFDPSFKKTKKEKQNQTEELSNCWSSYSAAQKVLIPGLFCWQNCERAAGPLAGRECTSTRILFYLMLTLLHIHPAIPTADNGSILWSPPHQCRCH